LFNDVLGWNKCKLKDLFTIRFIDVSDNDARTFGDRPRAGN
jgi:hypothetical protein